MEDAQPKKTPRMDISNEVEVEETSTEIFDLDTTTTDCGDCDSSSEKTTSVKIISIEEDDHETVITTTTQNPTTVDFTEYTSTVDSESETTTAMAEDITTEKQLVTVTESDLDLDADIATEIPLTLNEVEDSPSDSEKQSPEDGGVHEFDCKEVEHNLVNAATDQIPLQCILRNGDEPKTVFIVINKDGVDTKRLFDKNIKVVVKDLMIMDISPK